MIQIGALVGNYQVMEKIGEGTMGSVFLASHPTIGKRVALKIIHPHLATNEEIVGRFFTEAKAVAQVNHPHIVDVKDFGQTESGESFIVMELLSGRSLGQEIAAQGKLSIERAVHIAQQIADGLFAAHEKGVVHRDLKPDNIFLLDRGEDNDFVKILDFGLAKLAGRTKHHTQTGSLLGTPHYMAPEQAEDTRNADARADIYSLGCIFFEMLTGKVPFVGEGFGEVLVRHVREPPPLPTRINPEIPRSIERIVLHALAKKPEFRFPTMQQFYQALDHPDRFVEQMDSAHLSSDEPFFPSADDSEELTIPLDVTDLVVAGAGIAPPATTQRVVPMIEDQESKQIYRKLRFGLVCLLGLGLAGGITWGYTQWETRTISITIQTVPSAAELWNGEKKIGTTPLIVKLARSTEPKTFTLRKDRFQPLEKRFSLDHDIAIQLELLPLPSNTAIPADQKDSLPEVQPLIIPLPQAPFATSKPGRRKPKKDADRLLTPKAFR